MDIKCRSCRKVLISPEERIDELNAHNIVTSGNHAGFFSNCLSVSNPTSIYLDPDHANTVEWIQTEITNSEWSKGKLKCPNCQVVVGSFSFLNSIPCVCGNYQLPPLQLIVSKVDVKKILSLP